VHGLYGALAGMIGYALFASSRHVISGPDAALTLLAVSAIGPLAEGDPGRAAALAAALALLCGALLLLAAALRIGAIADFLSKPVLIGYLSGAALILVSTQLGKLFGVRLTETGFFPLLWELAFRLGKSHGLTLGLGAGFILLLEVMRRVAPKVPGALVVFVVAIAGSAYFRLESHGVDVTGAVVGGLPGLRIPVITLRDAQLLLPAAIGIALLTFPEGILLARAFGSKHRYDIRANQELIALAASNLASGLFQGFSVGASQSRTTINDAAGARTQLAGLLAAGALALFLVSLASLLRFLPTVALAAILISAGVHLVEIAAYRSLLRVSRNSALIALLVTIGVLVVGVIPGMLIGVAFSLIHVLEKLARPIDAVLREVPGTGKYHDLGEAPEAVTVPGLIAYRFYAPLFFANAGHFVERVRGLIVASPMPVRWFVVDVQAVTYIDVTAAEALLRLAEDLQAQGIALKFARANRPLREKLARIGLDERFGGGNLFGSVHAAVRAFQQTA
jgi:SulP family sulfate permease